MKRGSTRHDALTLPPVSLNWQAPTAQGGKGKPEGGQQETINPLALAVAEVGALVLLLDRMESDTPDADRASDEEWDAAKQHAIDWLRRMEGEFKASGLTAEGELASSILGSLRGAGMESSGLTAEHDETVSTGATADEEPTDAAVPEPADWAFSRMARQLGRRPC